METQFEPNDFFIVSKDFSLKEDEEIEFLKFYDIGKKASHILILRDNKVYECMRLSQFGSVFYGNYVYEQPTTLIIKEVDPLMFILNIIFFSTKLPDDKFSSSDLKSIFFKYVEEFTIHNMDIYKVEESEIETSRKFLNFLLDYFSSRNEELDKICEKNYGK
jgi:hypothetical protein